MAGWLGLREGKKRVGEALAFHLECAIQPDTMDCVTVRPAATLEPTESSISGREGR